MLLKRVFKRPYTFDVDMLELEKVKFGTHYGVNTYASAG